MKLPWTLVLTQQYCNDSPRGLPGRWCPGHRETGVPLTVTTVAGDRNCLTLTLLQKEFLMASIPAIIPGEHRLLRFPERRSFHRLTVSTGAHADYASIQDAIDHASAGDTIVIEAGVYIENLVVTKPVHLVGPTDPRFAGDELTPSDELPYALIIGTGGTTIEWNAAGGSLLNLAITQVHASDASALVRMREGSLLMQRCVISHGAETAVASFGGDLTLERCHIRETDIGIWAMGGSVNLERVHVEGSHSIAVNAESAVRIGMVDCCLEGRTVLTGEIQRFKGNDIDILFVGRPLAVETNRISNMVHLCGFGASTSAAAHS